MNLKLSSNYRSRHRRCFIKKGVLKNPAKFTRKHMCPSLFFKFTGKHMCQSLIFNKVAETLAQVFPCEFCKIFKNTLFTEHLWTTASVIVNWALLKELFREIYERFYFPKGIFPRKIYLVIIFRVSLKFSGQINPSVTKLCGRNYPLMFVYEPNCFLLQSGLEILIKCQQNYFNEYALKSWRYFSVVCCTNNVIESVALKNTISFFPQNLQKIFRFIRNVSFWNVSNWIFSC